MPRTQQSNSGTGNWAVALAFQIIEILANSDKPCRLTDLATLLGTSKPRIYRYLQTLKSLGYVTQEAETERYSPGIRLGFLSGKASAQLGLLATARPIMRALRDDVGYTVVFSRREHDNIYIADKIDGPSTVTFSAVIGVTLDLHCTAQGKLLLAFGDPTIIDRLRASDLRAWTPRTITDPKRLKADIEQVRKRGWAAASSERLTGLNVIAVPVLDMHGRMEAAIGVLGSVDELPNAPNARMLEQLKKASRDLTHQYFGFMRAREASIPVAETSAVSKTTRAKRPRSPR